MTKEIVLAKKSQVALENVGEHIGLELGAKMIKDYFDATGEKSCHFVGKAILAKVISQPSCAGIYINKAINEKGENTYVVVGVDHDGKPILEYPAINVDGSLTKEEGIVADRVAIGWLD